MRRTFRPTIRRSRELLELVQLSISSIALSLLIGCVGVPKFPATTVYEFDRELGVCGVYRIVNAELVTFDFVKDIPMRECPALFGFSAADAPAVMAWVSDRVAESKKAKK